MSTTFKKKVKHVLDLDCRTSSSTNMYVYHHQRVCSTPTQQQRHTYPTPTWHGAIVPECTTFPPRFAPRNTAARGAWGFSTTTPATSPVQNCRGHNTKRDATAIREEGRYRAVTTTTIFDTPCLPGRRAACCTCSSNNHSSSQYLARCQVDTVKTTAVDTFNTTVAGHPVAALPVAVGMWLHARPWAGGH